MAVAWVDYSKAFDRVLHGWIRVTLKTTGAPTLIRRCLKRLMKQWRSHFTVKRKDGVESTIIKYKCRLFQGDSLSPLLFCLSTAPLSWVLAQRRGLFSRSLNRKITDTLFIKKKKKKKKNYSKSVRTIPRSSQKDPIPYRRGVEAHWNEA